jgi:hypothetical protein
LMADDSASFCARLSLLNSQRTRISRFTASLILFLLCTVHVKINNNNDNPPQLTTQTSVTLLLPFSASANARPPTSVNQFSDCIKRRHTRRQPPASSNIHIRTSHMRAKRQPPPPPLPLTCPSHPPAYQVDLLQALESAQVLAQLLNVAVPHLLQRVA